MHSFLPCRRKALFLLLNDGKLKWAGLLVGFWVIIGWWIGILQQLPGDMGTILVWSYFPWLWREVLELWNYKCGPSKLSASCSLQWEKKLFPCFGSEVLFLVTWLLQCLCLWRVMRGSLNHIVRTKDHLYQEWKENCVSCPPPIPTDSWLFWVRRELNQDELLRRQRWSMSKSDIKPRF